MRKAKDQGITKQGTSWKILVPVDGIITVASKERELAEYKVKAEKEIADIDREIAERNQILAEQDRILADKDKEIAEYKAKTENEIAELKRRLAEG